MTLPLALFLGGRYSTRDPSSVSKITWSCFAATTTSCGLSEVRTPAMQSGLTRRRLTLREVFPPAMFLWLSEKVRFGRSAVLVGVDETRMPLAA
jgi:hypothetical protein